MPGDFEQLKDLLAIISPLVVLVVTLGFTRGENRKQRDTDWLQRQSEVRRAACAAVLAESERLSTWLGSEAVQFYEGPEPDPWEVDPVIAPLRAAIVQAELVCTPPVVAGANRLLNEALEVVGDATDGSDYERARVEFVALARAEVDRRPGGLGRAVELFTAKVRASRAQAEPQAKQPDVPKE
ncbi:hypothetical protein [Propionicimonas sp.]|uniref:hypothetical protein n=1 Tax=Propionicimonas sp. TaxID=1955623 RepID=UPI0017C22A41|nr:hypothetical protein [Propionicimonas sp.]MBU3977502.1 hypothetical protein [Actinomycetota bacterium]MBA3021428.1 hypothetical protein [Propionicimonas sp.]MBU3986012.1 hypothetical protein [Actinomycetota bacterium]MBU4008797.1 hypothetical protein [Actinomycetota bacterium]MBU4066053.1 hypothetical protein [Actinomycetota bacterium]